MLKSCMIDDFEERQQQFTKDRNSIYWNALTLRHSAEIPRRVAGDHLAQGIQPPNMFGLEEYPYIQGFTLEVQLRENELFRNKLKSQYDHIIQTFGYHHLEHVLINEMAAEVNKVLDCIPTFIEARVKHAFSLWDKMLRYPIAEWEIFDRLGVRITVANETHAELAQNLLFEAFQGIYPYRYRYRNLTVLFIPTGNSVSVTTFTDVYNDTFIDGVLNTNSYDIRFRGDLTITGQFLQEVDQFAAIGGLSSDQTISTTTAFPGRLQLDNINNDITFLSNITVTRELYFIMGTNTVDCNGFDVVAGDFYHFSGIFNCNSEVTLEDLIIQDPGSQFNMGSDPLTANTITLSQGTLRLSSGNTNVSSLTVNSGTLNHNSGTVVLTGNSNFVTGNITFNNLSRTETNDNVSSSIFFYTDSTYNITGSLTLNGTDGDDMIYVAQNGGGIVPPIINMQGSSTFGTIDYINVEGVTITDNSTGVTLPVNPINSMNSGGTIGWFGVTVAGTTHGVEGGANAVFTVTLGGANNLGTSIEISFTYGGTATSGSDYTNPGSSIVIGNGGTSGIITIPITNDTLPEPTETIQITLNSINPTEYTVNTTPATRNITSDEPDATIPPIVTSPAISSQWEDLLGLEFELPEGMLNDSLRVTLTNASTTLVMTLGNYTAGIVHQADINIDNVLLNGVVQSVVGGGPAIPDGVYTFIMAYQDATGNPTASTTINNVIINRVANQSQVLVSAPTKVSNVPITDTTIHIEDPDGVDAADVNLVSANANNLICNQTSATEVDCTVVVIATGDLGIEFVDANDIYVGFIVPGYIVGFEEGGGTSILDFTKPSVTINQPVIYEDKSYKITIDIEDNTSIFAGGVRVTLPESLQQRSFVCEQVTINKVTCTLHASGNGIFSIKATDASGNETIRQSIMLGLRNINIGTSIQPPVVPPIIVDPAPQQPEPTPVPNPPIVYSPLPNYVPTTPQLVESKPEVKPTTQSKPQEAENDVPDVSVSETQKPEVNNEAVIGVIDSTGLCILGILGILGILLFVLYRKKKSEEKSE